MDYHSVYACNDETVKFSFICKIFNIFLHRFYTLVSGFQINEEMFLKDYLMNLSSKVQALKFLFA